MGELVRGHWSGSPDAARGELAALLAAGSRDTEHLILSTSGTSGRAKLVRYRQGAFLRSCESWEAAGLLAPERLGGRGLCLLLAHSMGFRTLWNSLWTRRPICLITPEWFAEHPERVRTLLLTMQPDHVTAGPAAFRTLLELARVFPELGPGCFCRLRCAVSLGAPYDPALAARLASAFGLSLHNALGTTETMQLTSTLLDRPAGAALDADLGAPLPGVELGLEPAPEAGPEVFRLLASSPFGFDGYLPEAPPGRPAPPPERWLSTGDLVALSEAGGLRFVGREQGDFFKDGFGVKVPRAQLEARYADLGPGVLHVEPFPLAEEPGPAALVFVDEGSGDGPGPLGDRMEDRTLLARVRGLLEAVDLAASRGCEIIALGGFTSIITDDGTTVVAPPGTRLTSGNSLTVAVGARRLLAACARRGIAPAGARLAIVGATGNIGPSLARRLLSPSNGGPPPFVKAVLVGRDAARLAALEGELHEAAPAADLATTTGLDPIAGCDVIAIATAANEPLIYRRHLATDRPVVIADVSVPPAVAADARACPNVTLVPLAGTVALPGEPDFRNGTHTPAGAAFCCAAEAMLLGLDPEGTRALTLVGPVARAGVDALEALGESLGFFDELSEGGAGFTAHAAAAARAAVASRTPEKDG